MSLTQFTKEVLDETRKQLLDSIKKEDTTTKSDGKKMILIIKEFNIALNDMRNNLLNILPLEIAVFNIVDFNLENPNESTGVLTRIPKHQIEKQISKDVVYNEKPVKIVDISRELHVEKREIINSSIEDKFKLINEKWSEILIKAKDYNHFLTAILTGAILEMNQEGIVLMVTSSFHKKRLDNAETKKILLKIINDLTGENIDFQCIIHKGNSKKDSIINNEKIVEEIFK
jgi:hypothetical protein